MSSKVTIDAKGAPVIKKVATQTNAHI